MTRLEHMQDMIGRTIKECHRLDDGEFIALIFTDGTFLTVQQFIERREKQLLARLLVKYGSAQP